MTSVGTAKLQETASSSEPVQDIYFLDRDLALHTALQSNMVKSTSGDCRLQLCYYDGVPIENAPLNLINVPANSYTVFFTTNSLDIPTKIQSQTDLDAETIQSLETTFQEMNKQIEEFREQEWHKGEPPFRDTYFLEPRVAYHTAVQNNRVYLRHPTITGLQACYYDGEPLEGAPENLINVKLENALEYFSSCRTRIPSRIYYPDSLASDQKEQISEIFHALINQTVENRKRQAAHYETLLKKQVPAYKAGEPLRILFPTTRVSTVMQYVSKNLAHSFQKLGCNVKVSIEENELEYLDKMLHAKEHYEFDPHMVFNINHLNNSCLNDAVFNVVWYQDPMPAITSGQPLPIRQRDYILGLPDCCSYLENCGVENAMMTHHCVNTDIFKPHASIERNNKVVFAGSNTGAYEKVPQEYLTCIPTAKNMLYDLLDSGKPLSHEMIDIISEQSELPRYYVYYHLFYQCVRTKALHWLCENKELDVEVYGTGWDEDPIINPYFKGHVPHGTELSKIYASAKYALVPASDNIHLQRLAEVAACGCIPLTFDVRQLTSPPLWEDEMLYFRTKEELYSRITQEPDKDPMSIAEAMSCDKLAERILKELSSQHPDFRI